jgi:hypothetical protein
MSHRVVDDWTSAETSRAGGETAWPLQATPHSGGHMKRTIWTGTCTAIIGLATALIAAQAPATQSSTPGQPQTSSSTSDRRITVTGCLKAAPPSSTDATGAAGAAGTTGAAGTATATGTTGTTAASGETKFLLTNAEASPAEASSGASASAPPPASASASSSSLTYRLVANEASLSPHVGKKLELTGTLDSGAAKPAGSTSDAPALRVESGKVVAATCSE